MKRIYSNLAGLCILLALVCGCPTGETVDTGGSTEIDDGKQTGNEETGGETEGETGEPETGEPETGEIGPAPELYINEMRTESNLPSAQAEYIEFKITSAGNMDGLRVFAAGNGKNPMIYQFAPVKVKAGDYIILHLRTLDASCKDEYGSKLDESGGKDSCPTARDFWVPGSKKLLHKTDAVYVLDKNDQILDAVIITDKPEEPSWTSSYLAEAAEFLFGKDAWKSPAGNICSPADAVDSANIGTALTRSISRDETTANTKTAADWYVTANNGTTPGLPNNPTRYIKET